MPGTLCPIPSTLGSRDAADPLSDVIPTGVQQVAARLDYIVIEHTKMARALLGRLAETTPLARPLQEITIRELNVKTFESGLEALLTPVITGQDTELMLEVGVSAVADPGANLVHLARRCGVRVKPLVGPSSTLLVVMASGLNGQSFAFNGCLPVDAAERESKLRALEQLSRLTAQTQMFIEIPYHNGALFEAIQAGCTSSTLLSIAVDLMLPSEQVVMLPVSDWRADHMNLHKQSVIFSLSARQRASSPSIPSSTA